MRVHRAGSHVLKPETHPAAASAPAPLRVWGQCVGSRVAVSLTDWSSSWLV